MSAEMRFKHLNSAEFILQIKIEACEFSSASPGNSVIKAKVLRCFKFTNKVKPGDTITFSVTTYNKTSPPRPGDFYSFVESLEGAEFLEVFINLEEGNLFRAFNTSIISAPSDEPQYMLNYNSLIKK